MGCCPETRCGSGAGADPIDDDREDRFTYLDANNDGRVGRSEWHGAALLFNALDKNRDGFLTRSEMAGTDAPPDLFISVDVNGDGAISLPEWHWSRQSFDQRDANKDGRLSQEEFRGIAPPRSNTATAYQAGYDRGRIEGRLAGREDRVVNKYWDLEGQRELETADSGYQLSMGQKDQYQARISRRMGPGSKIGPGPPHFSVSIRFSGRATSRTSSP